MAALERKEAAYQAIAFADLAGFTALTIAHGGESAVELVGELEGAALAALADATRLVKVVGDAAMFAGPEPGSVIRTVASLQEVVAKIARFPEVRAGMSFGRVACRGDDVFGTPVNLAARIVALAQPGALWASEECLADAHRLGLRTRSLGARPIRGLPDPVRLIDIITHEPVAGPLVDPVCRMRIEPPAAAGTVHFDGQDRYFCSLACIQQFTADPLKYLSATAPPTV